MASFGRLRDRRAVQFGNSLRFLGPPALLDFPAVISRRLATLAETFGVESEPGNINDRSPALHTHHPPAPAKEPSQRRKLAIGPKDEIASSLFIYSSEGSFVSRIKPQRHDVLRGHGNRNHYQVSPQSDGSFNVSMTTAGGEFRTTAGFGSDTKPLPGLCRPNGCFSRLTRVSIRRPEMPSSASDNFEEPQASGVAGQSDMLVLKRSHHGYPATP